jgi:hypothetical protein
MYKPRSSFSALEYRPPAPQVKDDTPLEPYVPEKRPVPVAGPIHTRLNRLGALTAEPPKPAVVYRHQETQTDPVVFTAVPAHQEHAWYKHEAYKP